jgi:nitroreductase
MTETPPLRPRPEVLDFLAARRSRPAKTLTDDPPDGATLARLLEIAARVPDHGKLAPWRFVVIRGEGRGRLVEAARARAPGLGLDGPQAEKAAAQFGQGGVVVAVVASPKPSEKIPPWEQELSAGAVAYGLLIAALAAGWGANWLTGPFARDPVFLGEQLGLAEAEFVAGFVHIGAERVVPPERDRPDAAALTTVIE